jgi:hypothetical protein
VLLGLHYLKTVAKYFCIRDIIRRMIGRECSIHGSDENKCKILAEIAER